jgi:chromosome segregation ATPase
MIKEELVRRFEAVVLEEMRQFQIVKQNISKELSDIHRKIDEIHGELLDKISDNSSFLEKFEERFHMEKKALEGSFEEQRKFIRKNEKQVSQALAILENTMANLATKEDVSLLEKRLFESICDAKTQFLADKKDTDNKIHEVEKDHEKSSRSLKEELLAEIKTLSSSLEENHEQVLQARMELKKNIREHAVCKKSTFIIEKKIEDLYNKLKKLKENS